MLYVDRIGKEYGPPPQWLRPLVRTAVKAPIQALESVSLTVAKGEVIGLVGPNGAGKTTLIKVLATLLEPTSGTATIDGFDVSRESGRARERTGLVLEGDQGLYDRLSGQQNLEFYGRLAGMSRVHAQERAKRLLEMMDLAHRDKLVFGYSAGMKMRLSIARAMMADPPLLILDEPTRSLDPVASRFTIRLFGDLAQEGRALLLSSHRLDEVVAVCSRIVAIVHGRVCFTGTPRELGESRSEAASALSDILEREASASR